MLIKQCIRTFYVLGSEIQNLFLSYHLIKLFLMLCESKAMPTESFALIPTDEVKYSVLNPLKPMSI